MLHSFIKKISFILLTLGICQSYAMMSSSSLKSLVRFSYPNVSDEKIIIVAKSETLGDKNLTIDSEHKTTQFEVAYDTYFEITAYYSKDECFTSSFVPTKSKIITPAQWKKALKSPLFTIDIISVSPDHKDILYSVYIASDKQEAWL